MKGMLTKTLAILFTVLLIGSGIAAGAQINTYPKDLDQKVTIVVGTEALGSDYIAASQIQSSLLGDVLPDEDEDEKITFEDLVEDIKIGETLASSTEIDTILEKNDLDGLLDEQISFDGENIDVKEMLILGTTGKDITVVSSLTGDEDYEEDVVLEIDRGALRYFYHFDDELDTSTVDDDEKLNIKVLGHDIAITKINSDSSFTALVGETKSLVPGDVFELNHHVITLTNVGQDGTILLDIDGEGKTIEKDQSIRVNSIEVYNKATFYEDDIERRQAFIVIGEEAIQTYKDGDAFIGEDKDDPNWVWNIGNLETVAASNPTATSDGTGPFIGVVNDFVMNDDRDSPPKADGPIVVFPNNYLKLGIDSLTATEPKAYTIEFENNEDLSEALGDSFTSEQVIRLTTTEDDGYVVDGSGLDATPTPITSEKTNEIILYVVSSTELAVIYEDEDDNELKLAGHLETLTTDVTIGNINYGKTKGTDLKLNANYDPIGKKLTLTLVPTETTSDTITIEYTLKDDKIDSLGATRDTDEADEVKYDTTSIGTKDQNLRTKYGVVIEDPESNGADDRVSLMIPEDLVEAGVLVSRNVVVEDNEEEEPIVERDVIVSLFGADDNEADLEGTLILVGGSAVNPLTAKYLGLEFPTHGNVEEVFDYTDGQGIVQLVTDDNDKQVIIVAGFSADDTLALAEKLAKQTNWDGASLTL